MNELIWGTASATGSGTNGWEHLVFPQTFHTKHDAIVIRVIDFDRALSSLEPAESAALMLCYRDNASLPSIAAALGCSTRKVAHLIPEARKHLAQELDRLDLL